MVAQKGEAHLISSPAVVQQEYSFQPLAKQKPQKEPLQQVIRSKTSLISPEAPPSARSYVKVLAAA